MPDAGYVIEMERLAQEAASPETIVIDDVTYVAGKVQDVRKALPAPDALVFATLQALVDYVDSNLDGLETNNLLVHVESPTTVRLYGPLQGHFQQRFEYAVAAATDPKGDLHFEFGAFLDVETFVIALQALFVDAFDRPQALRVVGTIKEDQVRTSQDDGVTQRVTAASGIALVSDVDLPNPITLAPFRTFVEVEQPPSTYVLRAKSNPSGGKPLLGLFEADGGLWKLEAVKRVADWLGERLAGPEILA